MPVIRQINSSVGLSGGVTSDVRLDNSVGEAIGQIGNAVSRAGAAEQEMMLRQERMKMENAEFRANQQFDRFNSGLGVDFEQAKTNMDPSGEGFSSAVVKTFDEKSAEFLNTVPEGLRGKFVELTASARQEWLDRSAKEEIGQRNTWFRNGIAETQQRLETEAFNNPGAYDAIRAQGIDAINTSGLSPAEKAELTKNWDNTLSVRIAQRALVYDPEALAGSLGIARVPSGDGTRSNYLDVAKSFIGANENTDTAAIASFIKRSAGIDIDPSQTAWCAAWVNAVLGSSGIKGNGSLAARSFLDFGTPTDTPEVGDIVVLSRGGPETGHVGFFAGFDANGNIKILGGNQSNSVGVQTYDKTRLLGYRKPPGVTGKPQDFAGLPGGAPETGMVVNQADPRLASLTLDQRLELLGKAQAQAKAKQTEYQATLKAAQEESYDNLTLGITMGEVTGEEQILANPNIDNGQKSTLIEKFRTAQKENAGVDALIGAIASGQGASINTFDPDQKKAADKAYEKISNAVSPEARQAVTNSFIQSTGYIPAPEIVAMRNSFASTNPNELAGVLVKADAYEKMAPAQFSNAEGFSDLKKGLDLYRAYTGSMGYSPQEAALRIARARDPETARARDAILTSDVTKKALKDIDASDVAAIFDAGIFSAAPDVGAMSPQANIQLGVNQTSQAVIVSDYKSILEESLVDANGDMDVATTIAKERFQRSYGVSSMTLAGDNVVVKNPPEKTYPVGPDGTHNYVREQAIEALKAEGVDSADVSLMPYKQTDDDVRAGRPAQYQVYYKDATGALQLYPVPFYAEPQKAQQQRADQEIIRMNTLRQEMEQKRGVEVERRQAVDTAIETTIGPDWMKARAAEAANDRFAQDQGKTTSSGVRQQMQQLRRDMPPGGGGGSF